MDEGLFGLKEEGGGMPQELWVPPGTSNSPVAVGLKEGVGFDLTFFEQHVRRKIDVHRTGPST
jgi:hypothetical protein